MNSISSSKQRKAGVILQYMQMGLSILIQLVYTPIMLRILGDNEYGIYSVSNSIISYLSLLSLGFGASYIRYFTLYKKNNEDEKIKNLNGMYLSVFLVIGLIAFIAGLILSFNVNAFYNDSYSDNDLHIAKILMIFLTINLAFSFPGSVFSSYITSQEKFIWQKVVNMLSTILSPACNIILLYQGFGSIGMVITTTSISLLVIMVNIWYCFRKLDMKISFKKFDLRLFKEIFIFSIFIGINMLVNQLNLQTDKIILGKMTTGKVVAIYTVGSNINAMFVQFGYSISSVFIPKVNQIEFSKCENKNELLTNLFIKVGRIQWFLMCLIFTGFIFFGKYFIYRWAGDGYENAYIVALLLMAPNLLAYCQDLAIEIQRAKNKHQFRSIVYLIIAIFNVAISIWLVSIWGEIGAALGTTIAIMIGHVLIMNIFYQIKLGLNVIKFWISLLKSSISFIIPIALGITIMNFYSFRSLLDFGAFIILYTFVYCISVYIIGLNIEEKENIKKLLKPIFRKHKSK